MEYRFLGRMGTKVSELSLGAMTFGRQTSYVDLPYPYGFVSRGTRRQ
jgi:aryl-alcohol dehydrogenase-like predicted oxidoreductase